MDRRADQATGDDPAIVVVHADPPLIGRAGWIRRLAADGPTEVDAGAAEIVRELRERCEGVDARRP